MKNIFFKIMAGAALVTAFASCELNDFPTFDEADSFVAVDKTAIIVDETVGQVIIPVTIASIDPVKTAVTYEIVDSTAKVNKHYRITDDSGVLTFDGTTRTQNIVVDIIDSTGVYTGDLIFSVNLLSAGKTLNLGANTTCIVKIGDLDHPLAAILGSYIATGFSYFDSVQDSWKLTMYKDDNDVKVVWVDGMIPSFAGMYPAADLRVYGNVSDDMNTISFPLGQVLPDAVALTGNPLSLWAFDGSKVYGSGTIDFTLTNGVWVPAEYGLGIGYATETGSVSLYGLYTPGSISWTKE